MGRYCFHYLSSTSHHQEPTVPVPYISYECEARIVQTDTMSVTEFENDWILLAKKAKCFLLLLVVVVVVGFKSSCDNYHHSTLLTHGERSHQQ